MPAHTPLARLFGVLFALLLLYTACRIFFVLYNQDLLGLDKPGLPMLFLSGIRFDLAAICMANILFVILYLLSAFVTIPPKGHLAVRLLFTGINGLLFLLFWVDALYFPFVQKRLQFDAFLFVTGEKGTELWQVLPVFMVQFWWAWLIALSGFFLLDRLYLHLLRPAMVFPSNVSWKKKAWWMPLIALLYLLALRGGWQLRPLGIMHATEAVGPELAPAVLNTTFSLWRTMQKQVLVPASFVPETSLTLSDRGVHVPADTAAHIDSHSNVVIIMVESLSTNLLGREGGMTTTPFLDSLVEEGWYFANTIANARESVQGVPAVLSSIPAWMDDPFLFSRYGNNHIESVASLMASRGYSSVFFHGAAKGTMGFDLYCRSAGFQQYLGREQYPYSERHFDGAWGIWDHHYLPYMARELTKTAQPFVAAVLTLNTHHPFKVPAEMEGRFRKPGHPILTSMGYGDESLRLFFEVAKTQPWYHNTLFVISADHPGPHAVPFRPKADTYRVPLLFFYPSGIWKGKKGALASQIDILPTVASMLGCQTPVFSLGTNLMDTIALPAAITYNAGIYQVFAGRLRMQFDGHKVLSCHDWKEDPLYTRPLTPWQNLSSEVQSTEAHLKRKIQAFTHAMVKDKMTANAYSAEWRSMPSTLDKKETKESPHFNQNNLSGGKPIRKKE